MQENEHFATFIKVISDTYQAFERDINLMNHAFEVSDTEFKEINANLEREHQLKKEAWSAKLYVEKDAYMLLTKRILSLNKDKDKRFY